MKTLRSLLLCILCALCVHLAPAQVPQIIHGYTPSAAKPDALTLAATDTYLTLVATGTGGTPASFRWLKDGQEVAVKSGGLIATQYLYIPAPTPADAGTYTAEWTTASGAVNTKSIRVLAGTFVPAAILPIPSATPFGAPIVLIPLGATGLKVRWLGFDGREIPGSPRDQLVFTPPAGGVVVRVWNVDPEAPVGVQGIIYDDATGGIRWAPGVYNAQTWTVVR